MESKYRVINVMPDFGNGPYAWGRDSSEGSLVGSCLADIICGFPKEYGVSSRLETDFAEWVTEFERLAFDDSFDWKSFHEAGIALAERLKAELGDEHEVYYHWPVEDKERSQRIKKKI